jgi:CRP-like cAMP-binding protein
MASAESLKQSALFAQFDDEMLARLAAPFHEVEVPANQTLIEPRTAGAGLFLICDGTVEVEAHELRRELGPGEVVGEISLLADHGTRRARVVTKTPVRCLALSRDDFEHLATAEPLFDAAIRELAARRLVELGGE